MSRRGHGLAAQLDRIAAGPVEHQGTIPLLTTRRDIIDPNAPRAGDQDERLLSASHDSRRNRLVSLRALHVLEYALAAPAPRRQRTWLHRVTAAIDALSAALDQRTDISSDLLSQIVSLDGRRSREVARLRQERTDLRIAIASLRERIEPDPAISIDPADIRDRLATVTRRYRQYHALEADLVYDLANIDLTDEPNDDEPHSAPEKDNPTEPL